MAKIYDRVNIKVTLSNENQQAPILIGKGVEPGENVREQLEITLGNGKKVYVVPSTSIKGALRTIAYNILKHVAGDPGSDIFKENIHRLASMLHTEGGGDDEKSSIYHVPKDLSKIEKTDLEELKKQLKKQLDNEIILKMLYSIFKEDAVEFNEELATFKPKIDLDSLDRCIEDKKCREVVECLLSIHCPLCRLFGSRFYKGKLNVSSVFIDPEKVARIARTHVAIDRRRLVKQEKALYSDRAVMVSEIEMELTALDIEEDSPEEKLLNLVLDYMKEIGIQLGAGKTIGYGYLKAISIDIDRLSYRDLSEKLEENIHRLIGKE